MPADVIKVGPLGSFGNNAYIIVDRATKRSLFVDAPSGSEQAIEAAAGTEVQLIAMTHRHGDHWAAIDLVRDRFGVPVACHQADAERYRDKVSASLSDGQEIAVGETTVRVIHTPGHTPGSVCLLVDGVLISGDTLFPGGPGRSDDAEALKEMIRSITSKLYVLPDETAVYPGHGDNTTIGDSKREYSVFASKAHPVDLHGDVLWETS